MTEEKKQLTLKIKFQPNSDGRYSVSFPALKGCHTWGHTRGEAWLYAVDAVNLYLESLVSEGEPILELGIVKDYSLKLRSKEIIVIPEY